MKERKDNHFIKKPIYKGGNKAFREFIYGQLKYPKEAKKNNIEGVVIVRYEIDYKGSVVKTKVKKGIGFGCDEEAQRIIKLLKFEIPKEPYKLKISFNKETKIQFKLKKKEEKTPNKSTSIQYQITKSSKDKANKSAEKSKSSYTYRIEW